MEVFSFLLFNVLNHLAIGFIFDLSNTFKTFWQNYLFILLWGISSGYLFCEWIEPGFFVYFLVIAPLLLFIKALITFKAANAQIKNNPESFAELDEQEQTVLISGLKFAQREFALLSLVFLITFAVSYIGFFNAWYAPDFSISK